MGLRCALSSRAGLLTATLLAGCSTNEVELPDHIGNPVGSGNVTLVTAPPPAAVPAASPTPTPSPSSEPPAAPDEERPASQGCGVGPGDGDGETCDRTTATFLSQLESSLDQLVQEHPEIFDLTDHKCATCYRVKDPAEYVAGVQNRMRERGLCTHHDGEELAVKRTNDFNDQFDILTADLYIRRGEGSYRSTCWPAWF